MTDISIGYKYKVRSGDIFEVKYISEKEYDGNIEAVVYNENCGLIIVPLFVIAAQEGVKDDEGIS